jgi:hypothetical protein
MTTNISHAPAQIFIFGLLRSPTTNQALIVDQRYMHAWLNQLSRVAEDEIIRWRWRVNVRVNRENPDYAPQPMADPPSTVDTAAQFKF